MSHLRWIGILASLGWAGCSETSLVEFESSCPRTDLSPCTPGALGCSAEVWDYFLCLAERPEAPLPEVILTPVPASWPLRSLAPHRLAVESLGLWGEGEPLLTESATVTRAGIMTPAWPAIPALGGTFSRFVDPLPLQSPRGAPSFAESLDRHARFEARARMFEAFFTAALEGGSYSDHLDEFRGEAPDVLGAPAPLAALRDHIVRLTVSLASWQLQFSIGGLDQLLDDERARLGSFDLDGLGVRLSGPQLAEGWPPAEEERLGPDVFSQFFPFNVFEGDLLVSGQQEGVRWFLWKVAARVSNVDELSRRAEARFPFALTRVSSTAFVVGGSEARIPELGDIAEAWLREANLP